jgi:hypothetical protein
MAAKYEKFSFFLTRTRFLIGYCPHSLSELDQLRDAYQLRLSS